MHDAMACLHRQIRLWYCSASSVINAVNLFLILILAGNSLVISRRLMFTLNLAVTPAACPHQESPATDPFIPDRG